MPALGNAHLLVWLHEKGSAAGGKIANRNGHAAAREIAAATAELAPAQPAAG